MKHKHHLTSYLRFGLCPRFPRSGEQKKLNQRTNLRDQVRRTWRKRVKPLGFIATKNVIGKIPAKNYQK